MDTGFRGMCWWRGEAPVSAARDLHGTRVQSPGVLIAQDGRNVDISNSLEIVYSVGPDGGLEVDEAFLTKKMDQCAALWPAP